MPIPGCTQLAVITEMFQSTLEARQSPFQDATQKPLDDDNVDDHDHERERERVNEAWMYL